MKNRSITTSHRDSQRNVNSNPMFGDFRADQGPIKRSNPMKKVLVRLVSVLVLSTSLCVASAVTQAGPAAAYNMTRGCPPCG